MNRKDKLTLRNFRAIKLDNWKIWIYKIKDTNIRLEVIDAGNHFAFRAFNNNIKIDWEVYPYADEYLSFEIGVRYDKKEKENALKVLIEELNKWLGIYFRKNFLSQIFSVSWLNKYC